MDDLCILLSVELGRAYRSREACAWRHGDCSISHLFVEGGWSRFHALICGPRLWKRTAHSCTNLWRIPWQGGWCQGSKVLAALPFHTAQCEFQATLWSDLVFCICSSYLSITHTVNPYGFSLVMEAHYVSLLFCSISDLFLSLVFLFTFFIIEIINAISHPLHYICPIFIIMLCWFWSLIQLIREPKTSVYCTINAIHLLYSSFFLKFRYLRNSIYSTIIHLFWLQFFRSQQYCLNQHIQKTG